MDIEYKALEKLKRFSKTMPHFEDGRIDYHNAKKAFVIICFTKFNDEILLLKRSDKVWTYKNKWNVVAGYLDEIKPIKQKALEELNEETRITKDKVSSIQIAEPFEFHDEKIKTTFVVHPILIELKERPEIKLDFEHTKAKWVKKEDLSEYDVVPNMLEGAKRVLK
ncbi:NUDIX domain-containing protein [Candidatus Woesearchaeota archaeon]|nr:NUDIX domain-containing protein [Candidatus Woesearchaeota archaeon]